MRLRTAIRRVPALVVSLSCLLIARSAFSAEPFRIDPVSQEQADLEKQALAKATPRTQIAGITEFRKTAQLVEYPSGHLKLPGWLYRAAGNGPFPAVMWNHGSEKGPLAQAELARFYTEHGFVFFEPIREGHGKAPGDYIGDLQKKILAQPTNANRLAEIVRLHERFNQNVVDAVAWLKTQPFIDRQRLVMSGVSYGGIQTMLSAEKGLGIRAFVPFAPGAMSWASKPLQERLEKAAKNSKASSFCFKPRMISALAHPSDWDRYYRDSAPPAAINSTHPSAQPTSAGTARLLAGASAQASGVLTCFGSLMHHSRFRSPIERAVEVSSMGNILS